MVNLNNFFVRAATACVACWLVACGAKTGLRVPDAGMDAGVDAGRSDVPCIEVPFDQGVIQVPLSLEAELGRADVLFLVDATLSMEDEIAQIREGLRDDIAPGISRTIPDSYFAVATFADFPVPRCGDVSDTPFSLVLPVSDDLNQVQAALDSIDLSNGGDEPEAQVEALYQVATGEGISPYVQSSFGCPGGGVGYPCFRPDALPVVLLFSDAPFHNGPGDSLVYDCLLEATPHRYDEAIDRLNRIGARVIGMYSGDTREGRADLTQTALDTSTVDDGAPLVYDIGQRGQELSTSVVEAVRTLADVIEFDVDAILVDPDPGDGFDPTVLVEAVVPIRAEPMDRIERIDVASSSFLGVRAGTRVIFELQLRNGVVVPGREPQVFLLEVVFRGDRRTRLGSQLVQLVIPAEDGTGCGGTEN